MFKKATDFIKNMLSPHSFGLMVVNCNYYRPMTGKSDNISLRYLNDDKYFEICEQIKEA